MKKKIKFKIEYAPLSDDRINRHKDFDGLMAAYAVTPKQNVFKRWLNNRYMLFGSGLVVGVTFSALMLWNNVVSELKHENTNAVATEQTTASSQQETASTKPIEITNTTKVTTATEKETSNTANNKGVTSNASPSTSINSEPISTDVATRKAFEQKPSTNSQHKHNQPSSEVYTQTIASATSRQVEPKPHTAERVGVPLENEKTHNKSIEKQQIEHAANVKLDDASASTFDNETVPTETQNPLTPSRLYDSSVNKSTGFLASENVNSNTSVTEKNTSLVQNDVDSSITFDSASTAINDSTTRKNIEALKSAVDKTADAVVAQLEKIDVQNPFVKKDSINSNDRDINAAEENSNKKKFKLFPHNNDDDPTDTFENRYAQVTFVTPLSTNGAFGSRYMHYFSLNVLQGNTGALRGVEIGGLANITKGYAFGTQFGGLVNLVGGDVRGAQFGGLLNTSKSLKGAQFAGLTNINRRAATGMQTAGVVNISAADSLFSGVQLAGVANYNGGPLNGAQVSGAVNVNHKEISGGQISGAVNVANKINGYQIGVINLANKMNGVQIGVINIADSTNGASIGLVNVSRDGQFSIDLWGSDFLQVNGGLKLGNRRVYNMYVFGISPFEKNTQASDSLILKKSSLPFGFGLGLGVNLPLKKAYVNIDMMTWTVHDRYFDWRGINMLNQLRVTGGYRIHKYFGVYAGPVANVSVQDNMYTAFKNNPIYEYNGSTNSVRGWLGFVAGVQLF